MTSDQPLCADCIHCMVKLTDDLRDDPPRIALAYCDKVGSVTPVFVLSCRYRQTEASNDTQV